MTSAQNELRKRMREEFSRIKARNPQYSLRSFSRKLGIPVSAISEILSGRSVTAKMAIRILEGLGAAPAEIKKIQNQFQPKKDEVPEAREYVQLQMDHYHLMSDWYYFAILSLMDTEDFVDQPAVIARRLGIPLSKVNQALKRMERLEMIERDPETGKRKTTGVHFRTSSDISNAFLRQSHAQNLELAQNALHEQAVEFRDFSSMTMAIDPADIPIAKEMIKKFRRELATKLERGRKKEVFKMNVQLFQISKSGESV